jgi:hypothetical protein
MTERQTMQAILTLLGVVAGATTAVSTITTPEDMLNDGYQLNRKILN